MQKAREASCLPGLFVSLASCKYQRQNIANAGRLARGPWEATVQQQQTHPATHAFIFTVFILTDETDLSQAPNSPEVVVDYCRLSIFDCKPGRPFD
jgi:hypothetical protein